MFKHSSYLYRNVISEAHHLLETAWLKNPTNITYYMTDSLKEKEYLLFCQKLEMWIELFQDIEEMITNKLKESQKKNGSQQSPFGHQYYIWPKDLLKRIKYNPKKYFNKLEILLMLLFFQATMEIIDKEMLKRYVIFSTIICNGECKKEKRFLGDIIRTLRNNCKALKYLKMVKLCEAISNYVVLRNAIAHMDFIINDDMTVRFIIAQPEGPQEIIISPVEIIQNLIEHIGGMLGISKAFLEFGYVYLKDSRFKYLMEKY